MLLRTLTGAALAVAAGLAAMAVSSPVHAEEAQPDVKTAIAFSQETGKVGDTVTVTVTVSNDGTGTAKDVSVRTEWGENDLIWTSPALDDGTKFDLAIGESKVLTRTGTIPESALADGYVQVLYFFAAENKDKNMANNVAYRSMRVPGQVGNYTVRVVDAKTHDGVAGAAVQFTELSNSPDNASARVTSNAAGNAELKGTQVGRYAVKLTPPAGWKTTRIFNAQINITAKPDSLTFEVERNGEPPLPTPSPSASDAPSPTPSATLSPRPSTTVSPSDAATVSPTTSASSHAPGRGCRCPTAHRLRREGGLHGGHGPAGRRSGGTPGRPSATHPLHQLQLTHSSTPYGPRCCSCSVGRTRETGVSAASRSGGPPAPHANASQNLTSAPAGVRRFPLVQLERPKPFACRCPSPHR